MQRLCTSIAIFLLMISSVNAQFDPNKVDKKAAQLYSKALELAQGDEFVKSIQVLKDAIKIDPSFEDAYLSIAGMYGQLKVYDSAILYYEKARSIDASYFQDYNLPYSINLAGKGRFEDALHAVDTFLLIPNLNESSVKAGSYRKKTYEFAIDYAKNNAASSYTFAPKNLGDSINTETSEYYPTLTIDGKQLIFTRRVDHMNEDFFGSDLGKDDKWDKAKLLAGNINSNLNEGAQNISLDGKWLVFTGCNFPEGYGSCDLYISYLTPTGWSFPENLGGKINTEGWESAPSLSPDKRDLYFASRRPDGYGGSDIYVCHLLPNGKFGQPENLGPGINTIGDESCPFIHPDNQTLYFTSNGHPGYGDDDLFVTRKGPKGQWSAPKNLGYPINTIEKEGSLVISADGKTAYYASDRSDSKGGLDLYTFEMRNDVRPVKTLWVKGKVFDAKTNNGLPSAVELTNLTTREVVSKVQTDETGNYLITLPIGRDYAFNVNRKGYLFYSENFSFVEKSPDSTYNIDIPLQPLEANASVVLKNIFFDVNKTDLKPESQVELDNLVQLMKDNPTLKIQINGHTDNVGKAADNLKLSNGRAESVVAYITSKGIKEDRLSSKGFGATQPIATNDTEEGKAQNRRTELTVIAK
ncbi:OmpA family protein [Pinibacter aurantiacus]|uniref:OmpA family protein n=1 Tax=Pinibacter aurantiacus TaxID=2851599 RepID=A0A9E2SB14_9BACT|nr:OmpA family protein [Pinibacter aurantiacus]MBV4358168.1 OmpA family protein [Pinibacter aurantiacus]